MRNKKSFKWMYGVICLLLQFLVIRNGIAQTQTNDPNIQVVNQCLSNPNCQDYTTFTDTRNDVVKWEWTIGGAIYSKATVQHQFAVAGPYTYQLIRTFANGTTETVQGSGKIGTLPPQFQKWFSDTTICPKDSIVLDPYPQGNVPQGVKYKWYPKGDTTRTLTVKEAGCYSVEVIMEDGCSIQDMVNVKLCLEPAGQQGAKWFFGNKAGLDFASGNPTPIGDSKINAPEGSSTIANSKGELQFYADGKKIYNQDGDLMPCIDGPCADLGGSPNATQTVLIVPQPTCRGCDYLYNVFTTTAISDTEQRLTVSVVDMRENEGKGAVIEQNRVLSTISPTEQLVSSRNDKDSTYWVISRDYMSNTFRIFHASPSGLIEKSTTALGQSIDQIDKAEGQMKFSAADSTGQRQLGVLVPGGERNILELYAFNDESGELTGPTRTIDLGAAPPKAYGLEFSPNGNRVYITFQGDGSALSQLNSYDLTQSTDSLLLASVMKIDSSRSDKYGSLQIGPDGKIYMAIDGSQYLATIGEPDDSTGLIRFLDYKREGVSLGSGRSTLGLPNFVQNFTNESDGPGFDVQGFCVNEPTTFTASPLCQPLKDTYTWVFGDGNTSGPTTETEVKHTYQKPGPYTVMLLAGNDCTDTTFVQEIEIFDVPQNLELGDPIDVCQNSYDLVSPVDTKYYMWVNLAGNRIVGREKTYTVQERNNGGGTFALYVWNDPEGNCYAVDTIRVSLRRPPAFDLGDPLAICKDSTLTLTALGNNWSEFKWSTGETSREIQITTPGTYKVEVKDRNNCINEDSIVIGELPKARITPVLTPPTGCTTTDGSIAITAIAPGTTSQYSFEWRDVSGNILGTVPHLTNLAEGTYTLRISGNPLVCTSEEQIRLQAPANPLKLEAVITNATCQLPESGKITLKIIGGTPIQYEWWDGNGALLQQTTQQIEELPYGIYNVRATDAGGCTFDLRNIEVGLDQNNLADLGPDLVKCIDQSITITPIAFDYAHNQYLWSTGETTPTIDVTKDGVYTLTARNTENGCTGSDEIVVRSVAAPAVTLPEEYGMCSEGGVKPVYLQVNGGGVASYLWEHDQSTGPQVMVDQYGTYRVTITSTAGCTIQLETEVVDKCEPRFVVPEAFSPDGNGMNDQLQYFYSRIIELDFKVYNRWGEVVFATDQLDKYWDGTYRGQKVNPDVYTWKATFKSIDYPNRGKFTSTGAVTVVR